MPPVLSQWRLCAAWERTLVFQFVTLVFRPDKREVRAIKEHVAKALRVVTAPPVLVTVLLAVLFCSEPDVVSTWQQLVCAVLLLGAVPALAYPLQRFVPGFKDEGRDGQRKLAFVLSVVGYLVGLVMGLCGLATRGLLLIYLTYFVSVVMLVFVNKVLKEKASGHACSVTGTLVFAVYFIGMGSLIPCLVVYAAMAWSSVVLKRHTVRNLVTGTLVCLLGFVIALIALG